MSRVRDSRERAITYLRVSITDRCNLRCLYCMPSTGVKPIEHESILSYEEIVRIVRVFIGMGGKYVRLTGGEPLVRKGIAGLIADLKEIEGLEGLSLTTNGVLLAAMAGELKRAGLDRVNVSLDTIRPDRYREITRGGELAKVTAGLDAALAAGLSPVKINAVVIRDFNDDEIHDLARMTLERPIHVRFIEFMPVGARDFWAPERYFPLDQIRRRVEEIAPLEPDTDQTVGPAEQFRFPGAPGRIGFISPISNHFCARCNRLRLTSEGLVRLCLFHLDGIDLRTPLREGIDDVALAALLADAIARKPERGMMEGVDDRLKTMYRIGG